MDQTSATTPAAAPAPAQEDSRPPDSPASATSPGFGSRGRVRRRARFLRKARELAYRDLGGLVFSLHRFGQRNDSLVLAKLSTLARIDAELRALESSLSERHPVTVLREAGITACPRCAAIHSGEDRFCPNCGLALSRNVDLPVAGAPAAGAPAAAPGPGAAVAAPGAPPVAVAPAPTGPATAAHPLATPAPATPSPVTAAAVTPAPAAPAQSEPATQTYGVPGAGGRSPVPPTSPPQQPAGEEDQPTEIIRPPAAGS